MIAGHFGLAAGIKKIAPRLPLWSLLLATFFLDVVFIFFAVSGLEKINPVDPANPNAYGGSLIQAYYTHSLVGSLLISAIAGLFAGWRWGKRSGYVIAGVVFSHWILDLIVHRPDLPILPGNLGNLPLLGFGLWQYPTVSAIMELALVIGGTWFYYRSARQAAEASTNQKEQHRRALTSTAGVAVLLLLLLASNVLGM
ncbi:MAG: permease [Chloroflexi bacterium]|nr:MAG: permease [Chloroflexota bacterium]